MPASLVAVRYARLQLRKASLRRNRGNLVLMAPVAGVSLTKLRQELQEIGGNRILWYGEPRIVKEYVAEHWVGRQLPETPENIDEAKFQDYRRPHLTHAGFTRARQSFLSAVVALGQQLGEMPRQVVVVWEW